jgi:hypothetical protein
LWITTPAAVDGAFHCGLTAHRNTLRRHGFSSGALWLDANRRTGAGPALGHVPTLGALITAVRTLAHAVPRVAARPSAQEATVGAD